jgi:hypothetical protein
MILCIKKLVFDTVFTEDRFGHVTNDDLMTSSGRVVICQFSQNIAKIHVFFLLNAFPTNL